MTTPSLPLSAHVASPCWLASGEEWWWPCGLLDHTTSKGERIAGALVLRVAPGAVTLVVVPSQSTIPARDTHSPAPHLSKREPIRIAAQLAEAILSGRPFAFGYVKPGDVEEVRRVEQAIPSRTGDKLAAQDLDRQALRTFRLDRICWVQATPE